MLYFGYDREYNMTYFDYDSSILSATFPLAAVEYIIMQLAILGVCYTTDLGYMGV